MPQLELDDGRLTVDGVPSVLLCSSVFPFRLPPETWAHRLRLVRESGYHMVDLYVHWGFHEQVEGQIDLESPERDLRRFLDLAAAEGLLVMARPGPYICSETDGGGLPWWLHGPCGGDPAAVRTDDPRYLEAVGRWFDAVMPVLAAAQTSRGGPVALVQIENELDFFDCPDPTGHMTWLADRTRAHGVHVPIIACTGQGELLGAGAGVEGVVPTVNLYPDDCSTAFDEEARHYAQELSDRGLPLMITETNRLHRTLRREILAGARLVAPYLQTAGFNHLLLPSTGNWGDPGNLMTHDYDFGGYISADGRRRPEYDQAVQLSRTLDAWGERLASARPVPLHSLGTEGVEAGGALELAGGGYIVGPAEVRGLDTSISVGRSGGTALTGRLPAGTCPFWALDVPLAPWGADATLLSATAELVDVRRPGDSAGEHGLALSFEGEDDASVRVRTADGILHQDGHGSATLGAITVDVRPRPAGRADPEPAGHLPRLQVGELPEPTAALGTDHPVAADGQIPGTEELGLRDGRLRAELTIPGGSQELLVLGAADLVRVVVDGVDHGVSVPHGEPLSFPTDPLGRHQVTITSETWGRANFDDARKPALALGCGRGVGRVFAIEQATDVTDLWQLRRIPDQRSGGDLTQKPIRSLGGWSSPQLGGEAIYQRSITLPTDGATALLRLRDLTQPVHISIDGGGERLLAPGSPVVELTAPTGETRVLVAIRAPHVPDGFVGGAELLTARTPTLEAIRTVDREELSAHIASSTPSRAAAGPVTVTAARPVVAELASDQAPGTGALLVFEGQDLLVTVVAEGRPVSRHVLGAPAVAGGDARRCWIPASYLTRPQARVTLLLESLSAQGGILNSTIWFDAIS